MVLISCFGYHRTMADIPYIAEAAALIGDPARANMLSALKDDDVLSATELAQVAGVAPNTASGHLSKLVDARMVMVERKGRHRYFRLASAEVSDALESLEALAENIAPRHRPKSPQDAEIRYARSCYDHLAGRLGIQLAQALVRLEYIDETARGFDVSGTGASAFAALGIDLDALKAKRRRLLRPCPDWSEGHVHLGGSLGAKLFEHFCLQGWFKRRRVNRAVVVTPKGRAQFREKFGVQC
jgi:DNA-binding transcriptional ArsR family regulator